MKAATGELMKRLDRKAIEEYGIPSVRLMECAARCLAGEVLEMLSQKKQLLEKNFTMDLNIEGYLRIAVFCGPGNNGGDGVATARFLKKAGCDVRVFLVGKRKKMTEDTREMERRLQELGGILEDWKNSPEQKKWCKDAAVFVDAVFGVGLNRDVREETASVLQWMTEQQIPIVSADIPSGIDADTGQVWGTAIRAERTVTFTLPKIGHFTGDGSYYSGHVKVCDIGIPKELMEQECVDTEIVDEEFVATWLPKRPWNGHKGTFGKVYVIGGSVGLTGAPVFAAKAAARTGSGLVFVGVPEKIYPITAAMCMEAMPSPLPDQKGMLSSEAMGDILKRCETCDAVAIGPGLGRNENMEKLVTALVEQIDIPLILDADALYAVKDKKEVLKARAEKGRITILTPHEGEFAYLGGELHLGRISAAKKFSEEFGCITVLKGPNTITAVPDGRVFLNTTGNCGMAKGGSGDVLTGMILSLLGQGMQAEEAAALAVWLHGKAGDLCRDELGEFGMLPSDMVERIPTAIKELH